MALWGLLNLSGHEPAQTRICRHGLYTLMAAVHGSADPARSAAARAILTNIHYHPGNATTLYKAELKLKYAALARLLQEEQAAKEAKEAALRRLAASAMPGLSGNGAGGAAASSNGDGEAGSAGAGQRPQSAAANRPQSAHGRAGGRGGGRKSATAELAKQQLGVLAAAARAAADAASGGGAGADGFGAALGSPAAALGGGLPAVASPVAAFGSAPSPSSKLNVRDSAAGAHAMMATLSAALTHTEQGGAATPRRGGPAAGMSVLQSPGGPAGGQLGGAGDSADVEGTGDDSLDPDAIAARLRFLQWMVDPTVKAGIEAVGPPSPLGSSGGGGGSVAETSWGAGAGGAASVAGDSDAAAVAAAAMAAAGGDSGLMATLTLDPEERAWLELMTRMQRNEAREEAKHAAGKFMRGVLTRSLAAGAHSLWRESGGEGDAAAEGAVAAFAGGSPAAGRNNARRLGSARPRPLSGASAAGGNRPRSASVGRARPASGMPPHANGAAAAAAPDPRRPGSGLRQSMPAPSLAWPPAARANAAAAGGTSARGPPPSAAGAGPAPSPRFANLHGIRNAPRPHGHAPQPHQPRRPSGSGVVGDVREARRSVGAGGKTALSAFSLSANPWAPHILRYVQEPMGNAAAYVPGA